MHSTLQQPQQPQLEHQSPVNPLLSFEFTKRKKWDDLLLSELHLTLVLVLSLPQAATPSKILFSGFNDTLDEILGYGDGELVDADFADLMHEEDLPVWQMIVNHAMESESSDPIGMFARFKRKVVQSPHPTSPPQPLAWPDPPTSYLADANPVQPLPRAAYQQPPAEVLFEIRGHVHFMDSSASSTQGSSRGEPTCVLATATPYPSTTADSLNSFLEHKLEHERLVKRARQLRQLGESFNHAPMGELMTPLQQHQQIAYMQQDSSSHTLLTNPAPHPLSIPSGVYPQPASSLSGGGADFSATSPSSTSHPVGMTQFGRGDGTEDGESAARKRSKRGAHQYVCITCGRTDSPEWRKGPQGPKTLCNACGLRWAKKSRKVDDPAPPLERRQYAEHDVTPSPGRITSSSIPRQSML